MFKKIGTKVGKSVLKKIGKSVSEEIEYILNKTSVNPFDADSLNKGEDERFYPKKDDNSEKDNQEEDNPTDKKVSMWGANDVKKIMMSQGYHYDRKVQDKVRKYFEINYPGNVKYDYSGRRIPSQKRG